MSEIINWNFIWNDYWLHLRGTAGTKSIQIKTKKTDKSGFDKQCEVARTLSKRKKYIHSRFNSGPMLYKNLFYLNFDEQST